MAKMSREAGSRATELKPSPDSLHGGSGGRRVARTAGLAGHLAAGLCAAPADLRALLHYVIAGGESLAVIGATVANFRANRADASMELRVT